jgi:sugar/nucleoside kinase (ribokinase family)
VSLLVVGTVAFDSIETPVGMVDHVLGGSATFFSYAASFFTTPRLVAVVGEDFPAEFRQLLAGRKIDTAGLQTEPGGKTFYWKGRYHQDMNTRDTLELHLNVLETFDPVVPEGFRDSTHVFLANSGPATQARVLDQIKSPRLVAADTMDFWITTQHDDLMKLLPRLDILFLNDSEARLLTGEDNMVRAGRKIRDRGPKHVVIKRGEYGAMLSTAEGVFALPAFPTDQVIDPTGAGDTFAGGLLAHLQAEGGSGVTALRRAMAYGTVLASLTVEGFGLDRLKKTDAAEIRARLERYKGMLTV